MRRFGPAAGALALCGCTGGGNEAAGNIAPADSCKYVMVDWQVEVGPSRRLGYSHELEVRVSGSVLTRLHGSAGPFFVAGQPERRPPEWVIALATNAEGLDPDGPVMDSPSFMWSQVSTGAPYDPAFTQVVIRCGRTEVARLPIPTAPAPATADNAMAPIP